MIEEIYINLFLVIFPAGFLFTMVPLLLYWLFTGKSSKAVKLFKYCALGCILGSVLGFSYGGIILNSRIDESLNYSMIGVLSGGGYSILLYEIVLKIKSILN